MRTLQKLLNTFLILLLAMKVILDMKKEINTSFEDGLYKKLVRGI